MNINSNLSGQQQFASWCIEKKTVLQNAKTWRFEFSKSMGGRGTKRPGNLFQESVVKTIISNAVMKKTNIYIYIKYIYIYISNVYLYLYISNIYIYTIELLLAIGYCVLFVWYKSRYGGSI